MNVLNHQTDAALEFVEVVHDDQRVKRVDQSQRKAENGSQFSQQ